ncbi:unnamed protein product [Amoebophrya sp. A120]|nr:unnamed protein product [Amoebophrya sp. A120]|eukprot:GSA120T00017729001.1
MRRLVLCCCPIWRCTTSTALQGLYYQTRRPVVLKLHQVNRNHTNRIPRHLRAQPAQEPPRSHNKSSTGRTTSTCVWCGTARLLRARATRSSHCSGKPMRSRSDFETV